MDLHQRMRAEQTALVYRLLPGGLAASLGGAALLGLGLLGQVPAPTLSWWLAVLLLVSFGRMLLLRAYRRAVPDPDPERWVRRFRIGAFASGAAWGLASLLIFPDQISGQLLLTFLIAGVAASGMSNLSMLPGTYPPFVLAVVLPFDVMLFAQPGIDHVVMGLMPPVFIALMLSASGRIRDAYTESLRLRFENLSMAQNLEREMAERRLSDQALRESEARFRALTESTASGILTIQDEHFQYVNPAILALTGYSSEELFQRCFRDLVHPDDRDLMNVRRLANQLNEPFSVHNQLRLLTRAGEVRWVDFSASSLSLGGRPAVISTIFDITERKLAEAQLQAALADKDALVRKLNEQVTTDPLTGAYNRLKLGMILPNEMERATRYDLPLSLIMLDIDHFKMVNDVHGHQVGDFLLVWLVSHIGDHLRETDSLFRWGGEEFMVLAPHADLAAAGQAAERLRQVISQSPIEPVGVLTCSFGVAQFRPGDNADTLTQRADQALYLAKAQGRNRVEMA